MFGLNFVQQGFLFAGLAAAIPIAIHLLLRQRARRVDIGSVRFLQRVVREHNRMRRLRQWLLLAARILTTLLLAMLFARPFLDRSAFQASQREVVFLLDRSASMQLADSSGETVFEQAHRALKQELLQQHENTIVRVALFDDGGVSEMDWEKNRAAPPPRFASTDFGKALAWARDALEASDRPGKELVLFTDLQQTGLGPTQLDAFPADIRVGVRDFGVSLARNVVIERAEAVATEIRPKMPPTVVVEVRNAGPLSVVSVPLHLTLEGPAGRTHMTRPVTVAGASRTTIRFALEDAAPGLYRGHVQLEIDDGLDFDNRRYLAFEARLPDRLLLVDGQQGNSVFGNETYFLETALQLGKDLSDREVPSFETERIVWDNGEGFPNLDGFRVIALANVGRFSEVDARRLRDYLQSGGRVLLFAGDQFTLRAAQPLADAGILPAKLAAAGNLGSYRVGSWTKDHPIFRPFADPQYGDLRKLRFRKLAALEPTSNAQTLLETPAGQPLIVEGTVGDGKVIVFASTVDTAWSDWPRSRLFVPLIRQLFAYLTDQHLRESRIVSQAAVEAPGIVTENDRIVVSNVVPEESELARVTPEQFREAMRLPERQELADLSPAELASLAAPADSQRPNELWELVAWTLLGWLVVETFLAGQVHA